MGSDINTIRPKLVARVKEKYPHITKEQIDDELDYYFKYVKRRAFMLEKPEITIGIVGRLIVKKKELERSIEVIKRVLKKDLPDWRRVILEERLRKFEHLKTVKDETYAKGKTYKSTKRKKLDGRIQQDI